MDIIKPMSQLIVHGCDSTRTYHHLTENMRFISSLTNLTSLHIEFRNFSIDILLQFLHILPYLDSLTISILISSRDIKFTTDQIQMFNTTLNTNQITKLNIEHVCNLNDINILINLCPRIQYLNLKCKPGNQLESIMHLILTKRNCSLRVLCLSILEADDQIVECIKSIVNQYKQTVHYRIQRCHNKIFLQWEIS